MNILHFAGDTSGGVEGVIKNIIKNIKYDDISFDVVYHGTEDSFTEELKKMGVEVYMCKKPKDIGVVKYYLQIKSILRGKKNYDAVHVHTLQYIGIVFLAAIRVGIRKRISHIHNTQSVQHRRGIKTVLINTYIQLSVAFMSSNIISCSKAAANSYVRFNRKSEILYNAFNPEPFFNINNDKINKVRNDLELNKYNKIIGHVGRCSKQKNHKFILEIAKLMKDKPDYVFVLVGGGELFDKTKEEVDEQGLSNVKMLGEHNDIPVLLKLFDMFLLPSLHEGLPLSILEAQLAGVFSIVSEAVTKEVDLGIDLVTFLPIDDPKMWVSKITELDKVLIPDTSTIKKSFLQQGYDINQQMKKLTRLYLQ